MGRELKRVALDFVWPEQAAWSGYVNPHISRVRECEACGGSGYSPTALLLTDRWYGNAPFRPEERGSTPFEADHPVVVAMARSNVDVDPAYYGNGEISVAREARRLSGLFNGCWCHHLNADDVAALVAADRLIDFTHTWDRNAGWVRKDPPVVPSPEEVNVWSLRGMAHDSINQHVVVKAECARRGVESICKECGGEGSIYESEEAKAAADAWTKTEPPAGEGYQIWETVSEGSPISPVFATPEELANYMAGQPAGSDEGKSFEVWLAFIRGPGWAPSAVIGPGGMRTGPDAAFPDGKLYDQNRE